MLEGSVKEEVIQKGLISTAFRQTPRNPFHPSDDGVRS